ncbi:hypothetical protein [Hyphomonas sp.]
MKANLLGVVGVKGTIGWTPGTLAKMKKIYASDAAVIEAMTTTI